MRKALIAFLWMVCLVLGLVPATASASPPGPTGMVTDTADLLPPQVQDPLERRLRDYRDRTSIEIAVLIVPSLEGMTPDQYAQAVWSMDVWKIGQRGEDNGVLLLVVPPPEKIAWVATGRGIEPYLTDGQCADIVQNAMKPLNLQERRADAVVAGVDAIIADLGNTPWAQRTPPGLTDEQIMLIVAVVVVILIAILFVWLASQNSRRGYGSSSTFWWIDSGSGRGSGNSGGGGGFGGFGGGSSGGGGGGGSSG